ENVFNYELRITNYELFNCIPMPNTSLREAAPTASLRDATRTLLRRRSVQVSTSAPFPNSNYPQVA
ncbi:MAG: hypothetical protein ACYTX0_59065, partial [Nostoc sp.]